MTFPNLARAENPADNVIEEVTATTVAELEAAGIEVFRFSTPFRGEVPTRAIGSVHKWQFQRAWYYWRASGPGIPVEVAERLHAAHGTVVRVAGNCACPSPREWYDGFGVGDYHVDTPDGLRALADAIKAVFDENAALIAARGGKS